MPSQLASHGYLNLEPQNSFITLQAPSLSNKMSQFNLYEERRDDIHSIIKKRQQKAALASVLRSKEFSGKPIMEAFIGRQHLNGQPSS